MTDPDFSDLPEKLKNYIGKLQSDIRLLRKFQEKSDKESSLLYRSRVRDLRDQLKYLEDNFQELKKSWPNVFEWEEPTK